MTLLTDEIIQEEIEIQYPKQSNRKLLLNLNKKNIFLGTISTEARKSEGMGTQRAQVDRVNDTNRLIIPGVLASAQLRDAERQKSKIKS